MQPFASTTPHATHPHSDNEWVFGWNPLPGIVSVWASRDGRAVVWRREGERILCVKELFRPWLFATTSTDLAHLGSACIASSTELNRDTSLISYRVLDGPDGAYRYLLS